MWDFCFLFFGTPQSWWLLFAQGYISALSAEPDLQEGVGEGGGEQHSAAQHSTDGEQKTKQNKNAKNLSRNLKVAGEGPV